MADLIDNPGIHSPCQEPQRHFHFDGGAADQIAPCFRYWGKTHGDGHHLLVYHALDVAAVAYEYLAQHSRLRDFLASALGIVEDNLAQWISFFLALHDVGKFSESFQSQQPELFQRLQGRHGRSNYAIRHDTLGYWA